MFTSRNRAIVLWSIIVLLLGGCDKESATQTQAIDIPPTPVKVHTLKKETYPIWIHFTGKTQAINEVDVISRVTGELKAYHFKPGQQVKKNDLLFSIDKSEYQAVWDQKNAVLQKDKASYALAKANVKRYTPLVREQLAPREKLDELTATLKQLEATIKADEAALERAELDLEYCDIQASIDGQVGKPLILTGNIVKAGDVLTKIVQSDKLYVNFNPSAQEVALLKKYAQTQKPKVLVHQKDNAAVSEKLEGQIDFIDNISNASTGTVAMRAVVDNSKGLIFPGSFVEIDLFIGNYKVLAVHPDQISQDQLGRFVQLVDANDTIRIKHIKPIFSTNELVLVGDTLKEGDRVVVGVFSGLTEGSKVAPEEVPNPVKKTVK